MFHFFGNGNRYLTVKLFLTPLRCTWSRTPCMSSRTPLSASRTPLTFFYASSVQKSSAFYWMPSRTPWTSNRTPWTSSRTPSVFTGFNRLNTRCRLSKDEIWKPQDSTVGMSKKWRPNSDAAVATAKNTTRPMVNFYGSFSRGYPLKLLFITFFYNQRI